MVQLKVRGALSKYDFRYAVQDDPLINQHTVALAHGIVKIIVTSS